MGGWFERMGVSSPPSAFYFVVFRSHGIGVEGTARDGLPLLRGAEQAADPPAWPWARGGEMSIRKLKYHEAKLLKKTDFLNWKQDNNLREVKILRKYHIQDREDYHTYNKLVGYVTKVSPCGCAHMYRTAPTRARPRDPAAARLPTQGARPSRSCADRDRRRSARQAVGPGPYSAQAHGRLRRNRRLDSLPTKAVRRQLSEHPSLAPTRPLGRSPDAGRADPTGPSCWCGSSSRSR